MKKQLNKQRILLDSRRLALQLICAGSVIAMVLGTVFLLLLPYQNRNAMAASEALENYRLHEQSYELQAKREDLQRQSEELDRQLRDSYSRACPANKPLMQVITELLGEAHLELNAFSEQVLRTEGESGSLSGTAADLRISGTYGDMCRWLSGLQHLERPVRVVALQLSPRSEADQCNAHVELQFYNVEPMRLGERR